MFEKLNYQKISHCQLDYKADVIRPIRLVTLRMTCKIGQFYCPKWTHPIPSDKTGHGT